MTAVRAWLLGAALAALGLRVMPCADAGRAPGVLVALTVVVHEREGTDDREHQRSHDDPCGDFHSQPHGPEPGRVGEVIKHPLNAR
jgi:hypothetical protein